ncbi:DegT/DnrJ/EryC1/StrS family aminotransferase [Paenibacillus oryzisoli]|uniref:DegT/DnrJ/EryC1/StrS family aminotransferase n=1 Tax=Paenibacillus oryzisoli TaxID=1850517 RepID=UPI003D26814C
MKSVPVLDLSYEIKELKPQLMQAFEDVLDAGTFIMGPNVKKFEQEVADYLGVKYAITLNSGTDAIIIGLLAAGIGPGDEVITTPFTFFATAEAISQVGATPVFVDVDELTYNIDLSQLEAVITERTKAIIPVHLFGHPVDMGLLLEIANKHQLLVIEDTAQAFGAEYHGQKVGTIGDIGCFSFFPSKNLGAYGDGGLLATNNEEFAVKAAMLRVHGSKKKYFNEIIGYNSRLDEMQAAVLRVKLPHIDKWNEGRRQAANTYKAMLSEVNGIVLPEEAGYAKHVYHQYTIRVNEGKREQVQAKLEQIGVSTMIYYPVPVHKLPVYRAMGAQMPKAEKLASEVLSLPIWPQIDPQIQSYVSSKLIESL